MIRLWGRQSSINVQKVLWTLGEIGLPFERVDAGGRFGGLDTPEFLARNPHGRIPVMEDDGAIVWESNAIVRYLAARYSAGVLWPEDPAVRAAADGWMDWCATSLQPAFMGFFWRWYRTPETQRDQAVWRPLLEAANQQFALADQILSAGAFLAADTLTMADIPTGAMLWRYYTLEIDRPFLPALEAWYQMLCAREPYRRGVMLPYDELKGRLG
jgi:glutathione S-transferase